VCALPRRNPPKNKPTTQENGKAINLELEEEEIEDTMMDDEDLRINMEEVEVQGVEPITRLLSVSLHARERPRCQKILTKARSPCKPLYCWMRLSLKDHVWCGFLC